MRQSIFGMLAVLVFVFSAGCDKKVTLRDLDNQKKNVVDAKQNVKAEEQQLTAMKERKLLQGKMETELFELDKSIDDLDEKAGQAEADRQVELRKEIAGLRTKYEQMQRALDDVKAATGDTWAASKLAAEEAWNDLKSAVKKTTDNWDKNK